MTTKKFQTRSGTNGRFLTRSAAERIGTVENLHLSSATRKVLAQADADGATGDALRARIREHFAPKGRA